MFEYNEDLITLAQSDIECGIEVIDKLNNKKNAIINFESYFGKDNVDSFLFELGNIKLDLEEVEKLILNTKNNIENGEITKYDYTDLASLDMLNINYDAIYTLINETPYLTETQKEWAKASDYALYLAINIMYNKWAVEQIDEIEERIREAFQDDSRIVQPEVRDKYVTDIYNEIFKTNVDMVTFDDLKVYKTTLNNLYYDWNQELWLESYSYLNDIDSSEKTLVCYDSIEPVLLSLYKNDGNIKIPYEEWSIINIQKVLNAQGLELTDSSILNFAMFMYEDEGYRNWYKNETGLDLTKDDVITMLGTGTDSNNFNSLEVRVFLLDNVDIIKNYNYLYETHGRDKADDYLRAVEDPVNEYFGYKNALEKFKSMNAHIGRQESFVESYSYLNGIPLSDKMKSFDKTFDDIKFKLYDENGNLRQGYDAWNIDTLKYVLTDSEMSKNSMLNFAIFMYEDEGYRNWYKNENGVDLTKSDVVSLLGLDVAEKNVFLSDYQDILGNYNYIFVNEGSHAADQYLHAADDANLGDVILSANNNFFVNFQGGLETTINSINVLSNGNYTKTVQEYENEWYSKILSTPDYAVTYDYNDLKKMLESQEISLETYNKLSSKIKNGQEVNGLDLAFYNNEIDEVYYGMWNEVVSLPEYEVYSKEYGIVAKEFTKFAGYGGDMLGQYSPIIVANFIPGVGKNIATGLVFGKEYGESYTEYMRTGSSETGAIVGSVGRAGGYAAAYRFCCDFLSDKMRIPTNGSKIIGAANKGISMGSIYVRDFSQKIVNDVIFDPIDELFDNI